MHSTNNNLWVINGYSRTGKTTLSLSGMFKESLFLPMYHIQGVSSFGTDNGRVLKKSKLLEFLKDKESWRCVKKPVFKNKYRSYLNAYAYRSGTMDLDFLYYVCTTIFKMWQGEDILIEGEWVSKGLALDILERLSIDFNLRMKIIMLNESSKTLGKRRKEKGCEYFGHEHLVMFNKNLEKKILEIYRRGNADVSLTLKAGEIIKFFNKDRNKLF